ncbi:MAG: hypothetical protein SGI96_03200 [Bacteroidota bacterium]|nr:hypothetical protein [Bacteroidota bacterium]
MIPKYEAECPPLQTYLFEKPKTNFPMAGKYIYKSGTELAAMIKNHEATSSDIVKEFIANIKNTNYKYNAIVICKNHTSAAML